MSELIPGDVPARQKPLRKHYHRDPEAARIRDHARALPGSPPDSFHGVVVPDNGDGIGWAYGIHRAVGGDHDAPNPGDLLSAALAACLQATTRMVAEHIGIAVLDIEVAVTGHADVRGTLMVDPGVPVGFQRLHCEVRVEIPAATRGEDLRALMAGAERACVVLQTLKGGTEVVTDWQVDQELDTTVTTEAAPSLPKDA